MYEAFYGLKSKPFQLNPDPSFFFGSKQHRRAKAYLEYGVSRNEGFIVITGDIGAGKTTVLRSLIEGLHGTNVITGHL
ncbi:MAG: ATPase, partial [Burkholderiales bacterium]|nr:ATPase [Burkholderiales bacterium]